MKFKKSELEKNAQDKKEIKKYFQAIMDTKVINLKAIVNDSKLIKGQTFIRFMKYEGSFNEVSLENLNIIKKCVIAETIQAAQIVLEKDLL